METSMPAMSRPTFAPNARELSHEETRRQRRRSRVWRRQTRREQTRRIQREARRRVIGSPWREAYTAALVQLLGEHGVAAPNIESHAAAVVMADARFGLATAEELSRWSVEVEADPDAPAPDYWEREDRQRREAVAAWAARPAAAVRAVVSVTVTALRPVRATRTARRTTVRRVSSFAGGGTSSGERDDGGGGEPPSSPLTLPACRFERRPLAPRISGGAA